MTTLPPADGEGVGALTGAIQYTVINTSPHDETAYTQGLEFADDRLYESTGLRGESDLRIVDPTSGEVLIENPLNDSFFGEGVTERNGRLYQLTWKSGLLLIADAGDLEPAGVPISYDGEGWGICSTGSEPDQPFVMSNGTSQLTVRDPESCAVRRSIDVIDEFGNPVPRLNELECVGDQLLSNVWLSNDIVSIDLVSGQVVGRLDLAELVPEGVEPGRAVLNGIAYRPSSDTFFVTGKLWPVMYELQLTSG